MLLVLVFRWCAFTWMAIVAAIGGQVREQAATVAVLTLLVTLGWTVWLTLAAVRKPFPVLVADLTLAIGLVLAGGYFHPTQHVLTNHPSVTGAYPMAAVAAWAVMRQIRGGLIAGATVALTLPFGYLLNGAPLTGLSFSQTLQLVASALSYVLVGLAVGTASRQFNRLTRVAARSTEQAARLAEREELAARIHDDVLQHLAVVRRKGLDLADRGEPRPGELRALMAAVGQQEKALRGMVLPPEHKPPQGSASLAEALNALAGSYEVAAFSSEVLASGPIVLPEHVVTEVVAAARQVLNNVVKHAKATQVWVSALEEADRITVFLRDNGVGFSFDEERLRAAGRLGLLVSVRGRIERLGGEVVIRGRPGRGAEIELRLP
ncbi:signal transduction histidine kinase [Kibdelosporangium banguiense]|uniref:Signal transduction histidine kinase n=1 Tax=Kibdelosporangium banguiense TaxID=1365924 RepID=A0ABS4TMK4_9PSEU|nr:ATP-binding protein [Kibdelosporangium banguiense]MBP2325642.1 signal transduction histidine kinase [Kibdelosporangium banguiense]